jgi:hypothetical protein
MCAIETVMPMLAPAKAAAAQGIAASAIPQVTLPAASPYAEYPLGIGRFLNRRATRHAGLEGVAVI